MTTSRKYSATRGPSFQLLRACLLQPDASSGRPIPRSYARDARPPAPWSTVRPEAAAVAKALPPRRHSHLRQQRCFRLALCHRLALRGRSSPRLRRRRATAGQAAADRYQSRSLGLPRWSALKAMATPVRGSHQPKKLHQPQLQWLFRVPGRRRRCPRRAVAADVQVLRSQLWRLLLWHPWPKLSPLQQQPRPCPSPRRQLSQKLATRTRRVMRRMNCRMCHLQRKPRWWP